MNLAIDIGNSRVKTGVFNNDKLLISNSFDSFHIKNLKSIAKEYPQLANVILCSVVKYPVEWKKFLTDNFRLIEMNYKIPVPLKIAYKTPETLGMDRLAAVCGAYSLNSHQPIANNYLVINAGTCVTYDFLDRKGVYKGGSISPGVDMRFKALHTFTGQLPLLEQDMKNKKITGLTTYESIQSGVQQGVINEVKGIIKDYQSNYKDLKVVGTGGSMPWMLKTLKIKIKDEPYLVLKGLNVILSFFINSNKAHQVESY